MVGTWNGRLIAIGLAIAALAAGRAGAQATPNLRVANETLSDRLIRNPAGCDTTDTGSYALSAQLPLDGTDITQFDETTELTLAFDSGSVINFTLGDDPRYQPGRQSVHVPLTTTNDAGNDVTFGFATLHWDSDKANLVVTARPPTADESLLAVNYLGNDPGPFTDTDGATLSLDDASADFDVSIAGQATSRDTTCSGEDFTLSGVRLHASGTPVAP